MRGTIAWRTCYLICCRRKTSAFCACFDVCLTRKSFSDPPRYFNLPKMLKPTTTVIFQKSLDLAENLHSD